MARKNLKEKSVDVRGNVKVVTQNDFITAIGLEKLSLKARKLLYIAISQVRKSDKEFYEFVLTPLEFAAIMEVDVSNIYDTARDTCKELLRLVIESHPGPGKDFDFYNVFSKISYTDESDIRFKLNNDMVEFLLNLNRDFTQPLLNDFVRMKSKYAMAIWHLMQREMKSKKPYADKVIEFELSLEELHAVTGATDKETYTNRLSNFKDRILDKALREIEENCNTSITYTQIKRGRFVTGFRFRAISPNTKSLLMTDPAFIRKQRARIAADKP